MPNRHFELSYNYFDFIISDENNKMCHSICQVFFDKLSRRNFRQPDADLIKKAEGEGKHQLRERIRGRRSDSGDDEDAHVSIRSIVSHERWREDTHFCEKKSNHGEFEDQSEECDCVDDKSNILSDIEHDLDIKGPHTHQKF